MATPKHAADLLLDDAELARLARITVATATHGTLHLPWGHPGRTLEVRVCLRDQDGEPVLRAAGLGARMLTAHGGRPAAVRIEAQGPHSVGVVLIGRLTDVAGAEADTRAHFAVERVLVQCPHPNIDPAVAHRAIDLAEYAESAPPTLLGHGTRIAEHLNARHPAQLRLLAAQLDGLPGSEVAAAAITGIGHDHVELSWVQASGGHVRRVPFASAVRSEAELVEQLRVALRPH